MCHQNTGSLYTRTMDQIDQHAICLSEDYEAGIKKLAEIVADKKVVGVGESTHGTHEFFQLKADLFCELITKHDFHTFVLEDEAENCQPINEFIQSGIGDLDRLIESLYVVWRTQEVIDLILRLKDLASSYDIRFVGMDVEDSTLTEEPGKAMFEQRDKLMAENAIGATGNSKAFIWAHNSHISRLHLDVRNTGRNLSEYYGEDYVAIGQFFGQGTFNARVIPANLKSDAIDYKNLPFVPINTPTPKEKFLENTLDQIDCGSYFIDLISENNVDALDKKFKCRAFGSAIKEDDLDKYPMKVEPYKYYDGLVYFKEARHSNAINNKI